MGFQVIIPGGIDVPPGLRRMARAMKKPAPAVLQKIGNPALQEVDYQIFLV
jgi:hypothetical protein